MAIRLIYLPVAWKLTEIERLTGRQDLAVERAREGHATDQTTDLNTYLNTGWEVLHAGPTEDRNGSYVVFVLYRPDAPDDDTQELPALPPTALERAH